MAHRFYIPQDRIAEGVVTFADEQRRQMATVLRLSPGDEVNVFDGSGKEYVTRLSMTPKTATGEIIESRSPSTESPIHLRLVQGLPKGDKIELILQKCTEVGVTDFTIVNTERSIPKISDQKLPARLDRWNSIVREAAEQSGRVCLPSVEGVLSLREAFARYPNGMIAWENETEHLINKEYSRLSDGTEIALFIGPEGGFSSEEVILAQKHGLTPCSLGRRILRTETAAIVGSALLIYQSE